MREPERPLEPREPRLVTCCERCGELICEGDEFYRVPVEELLGLVERDLCESCALETLERYKRTARRDDA